jgi:hypothetical protein
MSIRITTIAEVDTTVVKIDGRLTSEDMEELARALDEVTGPIALDLSDLRSVERAFVPILQGAIAGGMELRAVSPYVELLLKQGNPL